MPTNPPPTETRLDDETERDLSIVEMNACNAQFTFGENPQYLALLEARNALRFRVRQIIDEAHTEGYQHGAHAAHEGRA